MGLQVLVVVVTIPIALLLPTESALQRLRRRPAASAAPAIPAGSYSD
jgi:hypothetical protein